MAQKLYLTNTSAAVSPQYSPTTGGTPPVIGSGGWEDTAVATRHALSLTKAGASVSVSRAETSTNDSVPTDPDNFDVLLGQWVSPPLTNSGTVSNLGLAWLFAGSADGAGLVTRCLVKIASGDGGTIRGYLTNNQGPSAFTSTPTGFRIEIPPPPPTANRELDFEVGDRVVVELGYRATNTTASPVTGTMWYGGTGTDLAPGGTDTSLPPFVELSDVLVFGTEFEEVDGTAQASLGGLTATALGTVTAEVVSGAAQAQLGALTANAAGDRFMTGTASSTLGALVATALGTVTAEVVPGQAQAQLGALTSTATADVAVAATAQSNLGQLVAQANATGASTGTAQALLGALVATADGTVTAEVITGAATALLGALLAGANASGASAGSAQAQLGALVATALGEVTAEVITGQAAAQLGELTATATGSGLVPTITGTAQAQLGGLSAEALADVLVPALAAAQLGALLATSSGRRTRHGFAQAVLGPLVATVLVTPPVEYAEMRPATVPAPALSGAARSGPTMKGA